MKLKVYSLTTELENTGTETQVFGTLGELHAEFVTIIEGTIDRKGVEWSEAEETAIKEIREHLEKNEIPEAWELFRDYDGIGSSLHSDDDYFWWEEHEVCFPAVDALIKEAEGAVAGMEASGLGYNETGLRRALSDLASMDT